MGLSLFKAMEPRKLGPEKGETAPLGMKLS